MKLIKSSGKSYVKMTKQEWVKLGQAFDRQDADDYRSNVRVEFSSSNVEVLDTIVSIPFKIDIESRSWGIKDIHVSTSAVVEIPITLAQYRDEVSEERIASVDLSKIKQDESSGNGKVYIESLQLHLNDDFSVDYVNSRLEVVK